ncbi:MIP/aquaporin family protein [Nocardioides montaniterrae]
MTQAAAEAAVPAAPTLVQKLTAEAVGTFILVLIGCGAVMGSSLLLLRSDGGGPDAAFVGTVGLAFGLAVLVCSYAFGRISGGHFNPAVSLGAAISGRLSWAEAGLYAAAQVLGGIIAAVVLWVTYHGFSGFKSTQFGLGANHFGGDFGIRWWGALIIEAVLTAIFLLVILGSTDKRNPHLAFAPAAIGLALAGIHFVAVPLTGTSVNPARSIGVALFSGSDAMKDLWVFIVAPLLGGALGGLLYPLLFGRDGSELSGGFGLAHRAARASDTTFTQQWGQPVPGAQAAPVAQAAPQAQATPYQATSYSAPAAAATPVAAEPAPAAAPIIQDGWQWDPVTQQWIPAQQQPPAPAAGEPGQWEPAPHDNGGEHTIVRPPNG